MRRHDWVYPRANAHPAFLTGDRDAIGFAQNWIARGLPLVMARQAHSQTALSLGLALPPPHETRRLACTLPREAVQRHRDPLTVEEAASVLCERDAAALRGLERALARLRFTVGVYGSTAWQALSGLAYRHDASDIDLVCDAPAATLRAHDLDACLCALEAAARDAHSRLDGEIRAADGRAVAWRELARARDAAQGVVLAKGERDVGLVPWQRLVVPA